MTNEPKKALGFVTIQIVQKDLLRLAAQEQTFRELFGSENSEKILNAAAPNTFAIIQDVLRQEITLGITRTLIDPAIPSNYKNLGLETIVQRMPGDNQDLIDRIVQLRQKYEPINDIRRKLRAHRDEKTAYDIEYRQNVESWSINDELIFEAINDMKDVMNEITKRIYNSTFDGNFVGLDAEKLLKTLASAV